MQTNYVAAFLALLSSVGFSSNMLAQTPAGEDRFEVISIREFAPSGLRGGPLARHGGPGTDDAGRFSWMGASQESLLEFAYGVRDYQVSGPNWLRQSRYDILTTLPPETSNEQFHAMLQNLLKDRFRLALHHEMKEMDVYDLVVAKGGPKLQRAIEVADPPPPGPLGTDKNGHPDYPPGREAMGGKFDNGVMQMAARKYSMLALAHALKDDVGRAVLDKTGLEGDYDFKLDFSIEGLAGVLGMVAPREPTGGPSLFTALQEQLGLKLEPKKESIDVLVIDNADRTPTDN